MFMRLCKTCKQHDFACGPKRRLLLLDVCGFATENAFGVPIVIMDSTYNQVKKIQQIKLKVVKTFVII